MPTKTMSFRFLESKSKLRNNEPLIIRSETGIVFLCQCFTDVCHVFSLFHGLKLSHYYRRNSFIGQHQHPATFLTSSLMLASSILQKFLVRTIRVFRREVMQILIFQRRAYNLSLVLWTNRLTFCVNVVYICTFNFIVLCRFQIFKFVKCYEFIT